jgi:diaminopimelate decarboxylase
MKINIQKYKNFIMKTVTPFYLYDGEIIENQYDNLEKNLPKSISIFFSMKANPNINFIKLLYNKGAGIEIASRGELIAALKMGVSPKKIVFAGPAKSISGLKLAIEKRILAINVESIIELTKIEKICKELNLTQDVNIRVNPTFKIDDAILQMGGGSMKFGIDQEQLPFLKDKINSMENINVKGMHVFAATQILDENLLSDYFKNAFNLAHKVEKVLDIQFETIDIGSGFGIDYNNKNNDLSIEKLSKLINETFENEKIFFARDNFKVILESGRYLSAESGTYITEVIDIKESRGKEFVLVKGGINHLLRPALINQNHYIETFHESNNEKVVSIGGQLCTGIDFFAKDVKLPQLFLGDYIAVLDSGAYGYSESMLYFLSHDFPAEYLAYGGKIQKIRKEKTSEMIIEEQINLGL